MTRSAEILKTLIELFEQQEQIKITYDIREGDKNVQSDAV